MIIKWIKANPFAAIVLITLVALIIYLLVQYWATLNRLERERQGHDTRMVELEERYTRETEILEKTATDLRKKMEDSVVDSGGELIPIERYRTIYVNRPRTGDNTTTPEPVSLPTSCVDCLSKVVIPYHFDNEYFWIKDVMKFNQGTGKLDSYKRDWSFTDEFNRALVEVGLKAAEEIDDVLWQPRFQVLADAGIQDNPDDPVTGTGVGVGAELLNFRGLTNLPIGANVAAMVVPKAISQSHILAGIEWRFFRNTAIGVAAGQSLTQKMVLINLSVFPMD